MLEYVVGIGAIVLLYTILFMNTDRENKPLRLLFFGLLIFSMMFLIWILIISGDTNVYHYDNAGVLTSSDNITLTNREGLRNLSSTFFTGISALFIFVLFAAVLSLIIGAIRTWRTKKDGGEQWEKEMGGV